MRIRKLAIEDYDEIISLWNKAGLPHKSRSRDSKSAIETQIKKNPNCFLGAYDKNRLVGTVLASYDYRRGWINRLAVDPEYRRRGVAQKIIVVAEEALRKRGARIICAQVDNQNLASLSLFKKCGYLEHHGVAYLSKRDTDEV